MKTLVTVHCQCRRVIGSVSDDSQLALSMPGSAHELTTKERREQPPAETQGPVIIHARLGQEPILEVPTGTFAPTVTLNLDVMTKHGVIDAWCPDCGACEIQVKSLKAKTAAAKARGQRLRLYLSKAHR
jgi:hypothetical protein